MIDFISRFFLWCFIFPALSALYIITTALETIWFFFNLPFDAWDMIYNAQLVAEGIEDEEDEEE